MDKKAKLELMNKVLREMEDLKNSQVAIMKKIGQIETENIELSNSTLEKGLPDIYDGISKTQEKVEALATDFEAARAKYIKDNKLEEVEALS
jgi:chaperonin cofactor prefoldin